MVDDDADFAEPDLGVESQLEEHLPSDVLVARGGGCDGHAGALRVLDCGRVFG
jgi:hypothetical protein